MRCPRIARHSLLTLLLSSSLLLADTSPTRYHYRVIAEYPHATDVFTQGFEWREGYLYESAGQYGKSGVFRRQLNKLKPEAIHPLPDDRFGEGITILDDKLYQLTWKSGQGFVYRVEDLSPIGQFPIEGEGWGLTNNGELLISSNGSSTLNFIDPKSFATLKQLRVTRRGRPVRNLNELEWIDGVIYANLWRTHWIVMIDDQTGEVIGEISLKGLLPRRLKTRTTGVLNGITRFGGQAVSGQGQQLLVTGKYWPRMYHIETTKTYNKN